MDNDESPLYWVGGCLPFGMINYGTMNMHERASGMLGEGVTRYLNTKYLQNSLV